MKGLRIGKGKGEDGLVLTMVYVLRGETRDAFKIRIISARKASQKERLAYDEG